MQLSKTLALSIVLSATAWAQNGAHHNHAAGEQDLPAEVNLLDKREDNGSTCELPDDDDIVKVTSNKKNAGWAMSPDQSCTAGNYCPYACKPGKLMAQWDPSAKSYSYPKSQNGGLKCGKDGKASKPFDDKPLCVDGAGTVKVDNKADKNVAFCQTVLPGNEAMLIPTNVDAGDKETIAVPDSKYWAETAAHYYINPPGVSTEDGCAWGSKDKPQGNWAPYVAGANQDDNGDTFVKIGWNPVYLEKDNNLDSNKPKFGVRIKCDDGKCNGDPCEIDPRKQDVNEVKGGSGDSGKSDGSKGAGDGKFCVVTAPKGSKAVIEVFDASGSDNKKRDQVQQKEVSKILGTTTRTLVTKAAQTGGLTNATAPTGNSSSSTNGTSNSTSASGSDADQVSSATTAGASLSFVLFAAAAYLL